MARFLNYPGDNSNHNRSQGTYIASEETKGPAFVESLTF